MKTLKVKSTKATHIKRVNLHLSIPHIKCMWETLVGGNDRYEWRVEGVVRGPWSVVLPKSLKKPTWRNAVDWYYFLITSLRWTGMRIICTCSHFIGSHFNSHVLLSVPSRGQWSLSTLQSLRTWLFSDTYKIDTLCQTLASKFAKSYPGPPRIIKLL